MSNYSKINISLEEFKKEFWLNKSSIDIPRVFKNIKEDISEEEFFKNQMEIIFKTCDVIVMQRMSFLLDKDTIKNIEDVKKVLGVNRVNNFRTACYKELQFRLSNENFPEFVNKQYLSNNNFIINGDVRDFGTMGNLLNRISFELLMYPSWDNSFIEYDNGEKLLKYFDDICDKNTIGIRDNKKRIDSVSSDVATNTNNIKLNASDIDKINDSLGSLYKDVAVIKETTDHNTNNIKLNASDIDKINDSLGSLYKDVAVIEEATDHNTQDITNIKRTYFDKNIEEKLTRSFNLANNTRIEFNADDTNDRNHMYYFETLAKDQNFNLILKNSNGYFKLLGFQDNELKDSVVKKYIDDKFKELEAKINNQHAEVSKDDVRKMIADELNKKDYVEYREAKLTANYSYIENYKNVKRYSDLFGLNTKNDLGLIYDMYGKYIRKHNGGEDLAEVTLKYIPFDVINKTFDEDE